MSSEPPSSTATGGPSLYHEEALHRAGRIHVAGVDEAGRGPLAGPVVAAAVIFQRGVSVAGVDDSKVLAPADRERLFGEIRLRALAVGVGVVDHDVIDRINILNATYRAMEEAVMSLTIRPDHLLVDGDRFRDFGIPFTTVVGGDGLSFSIAAASIVAKVTRDRIMEEYDRRFPGYGFGRHKGYATREHAEAIARLGVCEIHRRSFHLKGQLELPLRG